MNDECGVRKKTDVWIDLVSPSPPGMLTPHIDARSSIRRFQMSRLRSYVFLALALSVASVESTAADKAEWRNEYVGRNFVLAPSVNQNPYHYLESESGTVVLECKGRLFPLFAEESIRITDTHVHGYPSGVELEFEGEYLGRGKLHFSKQRQQDGQVGRADVDSLLSLIVAGDARMWFYADAAGTVYHYAGSNHAPRTERTGYTTRAAAESAGLAPCPACFVPINAMEGYRDEMELGRSMAGIVLRNHAVLSDDAAQHRIDQILEKVLDSWPMKLRGFNYRSFLVDSDDPNILACPGGMVFISTPMVSLCESDRELEAVLAQAVAHIEMRHGYRMIKQAKRQAMFGGLIGAVVGGALAGDSGGDIGTGVAVGAAVASLVAMDLVFEGYGIEMVTEADALAIHYLTASSGRSERSLFAHMVRKLEYYKETITQQKEDRFGQRYHPMSRARVSFAENARIMFFDEPLTFPIEKGGTRVAIFEILGMTFVNYEVYDSMNVRKHDSEFGVGVVVEGPRSDTRLFANITTLNTMGSETQCKDMKVQLEGRWIKLDNKEDTHLVPSATTSTTFTMKKNKHLAPLDLVPTAVELNLK